MEKEKIKVNYLLDLNAQKKGIFQKVCEVDVVPHTGWYLKIGLCEFLVTRVVQFPEKGKGVLYDHHHTVTAELSKEQTGTWQEGIEQNLLELKWERY